MGVTRLTDAVCRGALLLVAIASTGTVAAQANNVHRAPCTLTTHRLAEGYGSPDDVDVIHRRIYFTDVHAGVLATIVHGRRHILVRGLHVPEGIAALRKGHLAVVEQGLNRIDSINLNTKFRRTWIKLANPTGREGVDGIARIRAHIIVPDSPDGDLFIGKPSGSLRLIGSGFQRPTDVALFKNRIYVADENANAITLLSHGRPGRRIAPLMTPDDLAVAGGELFAVALGSHGLFEVRPRLRRLVRFPNPQGLATLSRNRLLVADSVRNGLFEVKLSPNCNKSEQLR